MAIWKEPVLTPKDFVALWTYTKEQHQVHVPQLSMRKLFADRSYLLNCRLIRRHLCLVFHRVYFMFAQ